MSSLKSQHTSAAHLSGKYASRSDLLLWINSIVPTAEIRRVESLATGVVYLHIVAQMLAHQGQQSAPLASAAVHLVNKCKLSASTEYDNMHNFKLIQDGFSKMGVNRPIQGIEKVVKGNYQANLEFLQWFCKFCIQRGYDSNAELWNSGEDSGAPQSERSNGSAPETSSAVLLSKKVTQNLSNKRPVSPGRDGSRGTTSTEDTARERSRSTSASRKGSVEQSSSSTTGFRAVSPNNRRTNGERGTSPSSRGRNRDVMETAPPVVQGFRSKRLSSMSSDDGSQQSSIAGTPSVSPAKDTLPPALQDILPGPTATTTSTTTTVARPRRGSGVAGSTQRITTPPSHSLDLGAGGSSFVGVSSRRREAEDNDVVALERQFYYDKLRQIELLLGDENSVAELSSSELASRIRGIVFAAE